MKKIFWGILILILSFSFNTSDTYYVYDQVDVVFRKSIELFPNFLAYFLVYRGLIELSNRYEDISKSVITYTMLLFIFYVIDFIRNLLSVSYPRNQFFAFILGAAELIY